MENIFFSIIIPTYNRKDFLKIALDSVLSQTFCNYELIIIDDGSTDGTKELVEKYLTISGKRLADSKTTQNPNHYLRDARVYPLTPNRYTLSAIRYIHQENKGPAAARNRGLKEAKGEFICFLDSDDRFRHDKLEITRRYIRKYPDYKIFHSEEIWYRSGSLLEQKASHKKPSGYVFENALKLCSISISTAAIHKGIFSQVGYFDEKLPACEDYDFWLRVSAKFPVLLIPEYLTIKEGGHSDQQSKRYQAMDAFRMYALEKLLRQNNLNDKHYQLAYAELKKKCEIYLNGARKRKKTAEIMHYERLLAELKPKLCLEC